MIILSTVAAVCLIGVVLIMCKLRSLERNVTYEIESETGLASAAAGLKISYMEYPLVEKEDGDYDYSSAKRMDDRQWKFTLTFDDSGMNMKSEIVPDTKSLLDSEDAWKENEQFEYDSRNDHYEIRNYDQRVESIERLFSEEELLKMNDNESMLTINLSDHYQYYMMYYEIVLPHCGDSSEWIKIDQNNYKARGNYIWNSWYYSNLPEKEFRYYSEEPVKVDYEKNKEIAAKFEEFFRIPMLQSEVWTFGYEKDPEYDYKNTVCNIEENRDYYNPCFYSVTSHEALYFTFETHTENGAIVDTSLIPGGYGIYALPYRRNYEEETTTALIDDMRLVVPLDKDVYIEEIELRRDEGQLLLLYRKNGEIRARIYDTETWTCQSDMLMTSVSDFEWHKFISYGDDFFVVTLLPRIRYSEEYADLSEEEKDKVFQELKTAQREKTVTCVCGRAADGSYGELMRTHECPQYFNTGVYCAFDGERLASVASFSGDTMVFEVLSKDGLVYRCYYKSSLYNALNASQADDEDGWPTFTLEVRNITVSWEQ